MLIAPNQMVSLYPIRNHSHADGIISFIASYSRFYPIKFLLYAGIFVGLVYLPVKHIENHDSLPLQVAGVVLPQRRQAIHHLARLSPVVEATKMRVVTAVTS